MRLKIILLIIGIIIIVLVALFGFGIKEEIVKGIADDLPEYNCEKGIMCSSCIIEGNMCSCGDNQCVCGDKTVDKEECSLNL